MCGCPYLREITMVFCDALSVKKPIPADRVAQEGPCSCGDFRQCPVFLEVVARLRKAEEAAASDAEPGERKDRS